MAGMNGRGEIDTREPGQWRFGRYCPTAHLQPFVRNYWMLPATARTGPGRRQRIVPDGCIDVILVRRSPTGNYQAFVVGTMTRPIFADVPARAEYLGIRFAPGGFARFFTTPAGELTDRIVPLEDLSSPFLSMEQIADSPDVQTRLRRMEDALDRRLASGRQEPILAKVLETAAAHRGMITVTYLADLAGWSPRHLDRRVQAAVGVGPKTFCRIMRFKAALRALRRRPPPDLLQVALEAGYYDQAHFIHDFNRFYGASPSKILADPTF